MNLILIIIVSSVISLIGTMIGASIGVFVKNPSSKFIGGAMGFAGGLMLSVVAFDLIPEAMEKTGFLNVIAFYILGIIIIYAIDRLTDNGASKSYSKVALITSLGLMLHNFPEGVIMGCGFLAGKTLGLKMSIIIAIHDIPEGLAVTTPLMAAHKSPIKVLLYAFVTALPTAFGAILGVGLGNISDKFLGACLSIASGIMMYVVFGELIPESNNLGSNAINTVSLLVGVTLGLIMMNVM